MTRKNDKEELALSAAGEILIDECRMVLPGIQVLFGFQLVSVFSDRFHRLAAPMQELHLAAFGLVAIAIAMIMTPAAFHRQRNPDGVDQEFLRVSSSLLVASMAALAVAIALEVFVVAGMVVATPVAAALAAVLFAFLAMLWFVLPRSRALRRMLRIETRR